MQKKISGHEGKSCENIETEEKKKSGSEYRTRVYNTIKPTNINIMAVPKEKREKGEESLVEEIMTENTPNLRKEMDLYIKET